MKNREGNDVPENIVPERIVPEIVSSDYALFLNAPTSLFPTMPHKNVLIPKEVKRNLVDSKGRLILSYLCLSSLGYLVSLSVCAQNGVGVLPFSHSVANAMHSIPWPLCPLLCGMLFMIFPQVLAFFVYNPFERRFLLRRLSWMVAMVPLLGVLPFWVFGEGDFLAHFEGVTHGDFSHGAWMLLWTLGAVGTSILFQIVNLKVSFRRVPYG